MQIEKNIVKKAPALGSSQDPSKVSLSIKAGLISIIAVLAAIGIDVKSLQLNILVEQVFLLVELGIQAIPIVATIWGIIRKFKK